MGTPATSPISLLFAPTYRNQWKPIQGGARISAFWRTARSSGNSALRMVSIERREGGVFRPQIRVFVPLFLTCACEYVLSGPLNGGIAMARSTLSQEPGVREPSLAALRPRLAISGLLYTVNLHFFLSSTSCTKPTARPRNSTQRW